MSSDVLDRCYIFSKKLGEKSTKDKRRRVEKGIIIKGWMENPSSPSIVQTFFYFVISWKEFIPMKGLK